MICHSCSNLPLHCDANTSNHRCFVMTVTIQVERLVSGPPSDPLLLLNPEPAEIPPSPESPSALEPKSSTELPKLSLPKIQLPEHTIPSLSLSEIARVPERTDNGKTPSEKSSEAAVAISKAPSPKREKNEPNIIFNELSLQKLTGEIIEHTEKKPIQSVLEIFQKAAEGRRLELRKKNIVGKQALELRSKSGAELLPLEKRQKPLYTENIDRAKAERQRKLEGGGRGEAARMKLPKGVAAMKSWRKNRNGTFSLAAEAKARAAAAAKVQKEQEAASERQRAQDATRKKVAANFFGNGDKEVDTANNDIVAGPPKGVPVLSMWRRNSNGSISGIISGHPAHVDGDTISTSPLKGEAISGSVVTTQSGSRYVMHKLFALFPRLYFVLKSLIMYFHTSWYLLLQILFERKSKLFPLRLAVVRVEIGCGTASVGKASETTLCRKHR